jgi:hypothetical protein
MIIIITTEDKSVRIFMKMRAMPHILPNFAYLYQYSNELAVFPERRRFLFVAINPEMPQSQRGENTNC